MSIFYQYFYIFQWWHQNFNIKSSFFLLKLVRSCTNDLPKTSTDWIGTFQWRFSVFKMKIWKYDWTLIRGGTNFFFSTRMFHPPIRRRTTPTFWMGKRSTIVCMKFGVVIFIHKKSFSKWKIVIYVVHLHITKESFIQKLLSYTPTL